MSILRCSVAEVDESTWTHATLPPRGFGLCDPGTIIETARLASLTNVDTLSFGAVKNFDSIAPEKAVATTWPLGTDIRP